VEIFSTRADGSFIIDFDCLKRRINALYTKIDFSDFQKAAQR